MLILVSLLILALQAVAGTQNTGIIIVSIVQYSQKIIAGQKFRPTQLLLHYRNI